MGNIVFFLCYDVVLRFGLSYGIHRAGKNKLHDSYDKGLAISLAEHYNKMFGEGTHWIEDETGERIYPEEKENSE